MNEKVGAPYLRDGVCILPERPDASARLDGIAAKAKEFGGDATHVSGARLSEPRAIALVEQFRAARAEECDGPPDVLAAMLDRCEHALGTFVEAAAALENAAR